MIKVSCVECLKETIKSPCFIKPNARYFCSKECYWINKRKLKPAIKKNCPQCGTEFLCGGRNRKQKQVRFCSTICFSTNRRNGKKFNCFKCGQEVIRNPSHIKNRVFCSKLCADSSRQKTGRKKIVVSKYCTKRLEWISRIKCCQRCGYKDFPQILNIHHIDRNRTNNSDINLELLCPNCHRVEHHLHRLPRKKNIKNIPI